MTNKKSGSSANGSARGGQNQPASSTSNSAADKSNSAMVKEGWGGRSTFQRSYGLDMTPEGIEEGNRLLDGFRQADMEAEKRQKK